MGAGPSSLAAQAAAYLGCGPASVDWDIDASSAYAQLPPRPPGSQGGWAGGLPDAVLANVFRLSEKAPPARSRATAAGAAEQQSRQLGADLRAAPAIRLVCRTWRRVHDELLVRSLRPRALDPVALARAFPNLTALDLTRVAFPHLPDLAALFPRLPRLASLTMRDNGTGHLASGTIASALADRRCVLTRLNVGENHIDCRGATVLAAALPGNAVLQELLLRDNGICDAGAVALARALGASRSLRVLDLSANPGIGPESAAAFAAALSSHPPPPLAALNLGGCALGDAGARHLGDALPRCAALRLLGLHGGPAGRIGDAGAAALAAGLARCDALQALDLFGNGIGDMGAAALARALCANRSLTRLDLFDNKAMGADGVAALAATLARGGGAAPALALVRVDASRVKDADAMQEMIVAANGRLVAAGVRGAANA